MVSLAGQSKPSQVSDQQGSKHAAQQGSRSPVPGRLVFSGEGVQGETAVGASQLPPEPVVQARAILLLQLKDRV